MQAGARISEYVAGGYAALRALTALRTLSGSVDRLIEVDVSVLESLLSTLPYPMLMAEKMLMQGFHYPFPALAHIEKTASGYREIPILWNPTL